jgi:hypothetical protein
LDFIAIDDRLHLKSADGRFAYIALNDLSRGILTLVDKSSQLEMCFESVERLIAGGWVVD